MTSGGAEAIAKIENVRRTGDISIESSFGAPLGGTIEVVMVPNRGYYESVDLGAISQTKGWNGETGWEQGLMGFRTLAGPELETIASQSRVNGFVGQPSGDSKDLRIERLEDAELNGTAYYTLEMQSGSGPSSTMYIDKQSHLVVGTTMSLEIPNLGPAAVNVDIGGYEAVGGVMMPSALTVTVEGISTTRLTFSKTVVNSEVDPAIFDAPE